MKQFYIRYQQNSENSDSPLYVRIAVSLNPIHDRAVIPNNELDIQDRIYFEGSAPNEVMQELEREILSIAGITPYLKYSLDYFSQVDQKKVKNQELFIKFSPYFLGIDPLESSKPARQEKEKYISVPSRIFPVYQQFVSEHSPEIYAE